MSLWIANHSVCSYPSYDVNLKASKLLCILQVFDYFRGVSFATRFSCSSVKLRPISRLSAMSGLSPISTASQESGQSLDAASASEPCTRWNSRTCRLGQSSSSDPTCHLGTAPHVCSRQLSLAHSGPPNTISGGARNITGRDGFLLPKPFMNW